MQQSGLLYCNTRTYFSQVEDNNNRQDVFECVTELNYLPSSIIQFKEVNNPDAEWVKVQGNAQFRTQYKELYGNLFCLSAIKVSPAEEASLLELNEIFLNFGHFALIILNAPEFLKKVEQTLNETGYMYQIDFVDYLDLPTYSGNKSPFQKPKNYSWQQELRIFIKTNQFKKIDPLKLFIGNMENFSELWNMNASKRYIKSI